MLSTSNFTLKHILTFISFFAIALVMGVMTTEFSSGTLISLVLGLSFFIAAFMNTELGLYLLIFSMLLSPEISVGGGGGEVAQRGGVSVRLDDFLLLVIGLSWFAKTAINKELGLFLKTPLNKPIFFYLIICLISTAMGVMGGRVDAKVGFFYVLKYFEYFIVYFMMVNHLENRDQVNRFLICLFITCFVVAIYGMIQIPLDGRVSAPFEGEQGEPNTLGGYLLFVGALAAGLFPKIEDPKAKLFTGLLIFTIIPPLLYTYSRSTYVSILPAALYLMIRSTRPQILIGIFLALLVASPFLLPKTVMERIKHTVGQAERMGQVQVGDIRLDTSISARLNSVEKVAIGFIQQPVLGHGVTGFSFLDAQYFRVLVETGLIGLLAFIYLIISIFKLAIRTSRQLVTPYYKGLVFGFIAGFIGLLVHAVGANTFIIVRIMEPFWFTAAIVFALPKIEAQEHDAGAPAVSMGHRE
jgi:O-antigen ligase